MYALKFMVLIRMEIVSLVNVLSRGAEGQSALSERTSRGGSRSKAASQFTILCTPDGRRVGQ